MDSRRRSSVVLPAYMGPIIKSIDAIDAVVEWGVGDKVGGWVIVDMLFILRVDKLNKIIF